MLFFIKKFLQAFFLPPGLIYLLFFLSLILIILKKKWGKRLLVFTLVLFFLLSIMPVSNLLLKTLENKYPPLLTPPKDIKYIVVLGGGALNRDTQLPSTSRLSPSSTARLLEGIRLFNQLEDAVLVTSGGNSRNIPIQQLTCSQMKELAVLMGIQKDKILPLCDSRDTYEEAKNIQQLLGEQSFLLVTSAFHIPRAMFILNKIGLNPIPAPANFMGQSKYNYSYSPFLPAAIYFTYSSSAIREHIGQIFYRFLK
jgi:uncharacterized SAM-binding protein YcdF (DUF218 family)